MGFLILSYMHAEYVLRYRNLIDDIAYPLRTFDRRPYVRFSQLWYCRNLFYCNSFSKIYFELEQVFNGMFIYFVGVCNQLKVSKLPRYITKFNQHISIFATKSFNRTTAFRCIPPTRSAWVGTGHQKRKTASQTWYIIGGSTKFFRCASIVSIVIQAWVFFTDTSLKSRLNVLGVHLLYL